MFRRQILVCVAGRKPLRSRRARRFRLFQFATHRQARSNVITGEYPHFGNVSSSFNATIANYVNSNLAQFKTDSVANLQARIEYHTVGNEKHAANASVHVHGKLEPEQINSRYISIIVRLDYFNGGANGTSLLQTFNYASKPAKR